MDKLIWGLGIAFIVIVFLSFILWKKMTGYKISVKGYLPKYPGTWKIIGIIFAGGAIYGIYLIVYSYIPPKSERLYKQVVEKQKAQEVEPLLKDLEKIARGTGTAAAIGEAKEIKKKIEAIEKRYNEVLKPEPQKISPVKHPKTELVMSFLAGDQKMIEEKDQAGYQEVPVTELACTDFEITLAYISKSGQKMTTKLARWDKAHFYAGWIKNTHPKKKYANFPIMLQEDETPPYEPKTLGKNIKIFPLFTGYMEENKIQVKVFKRVSSG